MANINIANARAHLQSFEFQKLLIEDLGWSQPDSRKPVAMQVKGAALTRREIASLAGVAVFEVIADDGGVPSADMRRAVADAVAQQQRENLVIFVDAGRTSSVWYWVKREGGRAAPRSHTYVQGQPGDVLINKLSAMFVDIGELDADGNIPLIEVASRIKQALDVEPVTKQFFSDFQRMHQGLLAAISGVADERDRRWYASALLNRLMFVYFLQQRGFLRDQQGLDDRRYLQHRLAESRARGADRFYHEFLRALFFKGFATPEPQRDPATVALIGHVRYLNGGLFLPHAVEQHHPAIAIADDVFGQIFELFQTYDWSLDDTPGGNEKEINPAVLGYIFEKYINQKAFGAYYTRTEITEYLCEQTIHRLILDRLNETLPPAKQFASIGDVLLKPSAPQLHALLHDILPGLRLIDPSCGSGAFLVAAMRTLITIYSGLFGKAKFSGDAQLRGWVEQIERDHPSISYFIRKQIITNNLYGVDIMAEATEIARLRLFLALVSAADRLEDLEPLPNIDFNILAGNSLIGLLKVDEARADRALLHRAKDGTITQIAQHSLFAQGSTQSYRDLVDEKNRLVASYRSAAQLVRQDDVAAPALQDLRDQIQAHRSRAADLLDALLLDEFQTLGIKYEQATWDAAKNKEGKAARRPLTLGDIRALQPFHWGYEFDEVVNERGGFDAIITNPPWETLKPEAKEFFALHSALVSKKKMNVKDFEKEQDKLTQDPAIRDAWLAYLSGFPHQSEYFRLAPQFQHQSTVINGKRTGSDINLYKLFVEQCYNLLHDAGQCGIVVPSGVYTDLGATGLRKLLFDQAEVRALLSVSNERYLFEGVHHSFRYVFLTFEKSGQTQSFAAAFRINPREAVGPEQIDTFLNTPEQHLQIDLDIIRHLSPETLSVMEFRNGTDVSIARKLYKYPTLGENLSIPWNFRLKREFDISMNSGMFYTAAAPNTLPLFTGKMFNQFTLTPEHSGYWIAESAGRKALLGKQPDTGQPLDYQGYRWVHRRIARNTDSRTFITTIAPPNVFTEVNSTVLNVSASGTTNAQQLYLCAVCNSLALDWMLRQKVAATLNMFYIYQLPVPRLREGDPMFAPIVERAAKLICTAPEYDALAAEVGLGDHSAGVTDPAKREQLRAELDAMVAHLYGLSEAELAHILASFPLVEQRIKDGVLTEYRRRQPSPDDAQVAAMVAAGESDMVEFKESAVWNAHTGKKDPALTEPIIKAVASFLNDYEGGNVFVGIDKDWKVVGIASDIAAASAKANLDDYERAVRTALSAKLGGQNSPYYRFSFHPIGAQQVLRIEVRPAPAAVYVDGDLYIRDGGGKKKLNAQQAMEYAKHRWG